MSQYVSVRSNWASTNAQSLDLVCDVGFEDNDDSIGLEEANAEDNQHPTSAKSSSNEVVTSVTLRSPSDDGREDPLVTVTLLRPEQDQFFSIQVLSSSKNIEFYHREYLGTSQGSRVMEIESESIYETSFQFQEPVQEITLKCLKLADASELVIYCLQINLIKRMQRNAPMHLPFDLNRVRSMIDESNLSSNARQFMSDLQHMQERRQTTTSSSSQLNLGQLMLMMKGMTTGPSIEKQPLPTHLAPLPKEIKRATGGDVKNTRAAEDHPMELPDISTLESRLQVHLNTCMKQLQEHFDARFNRLEERLDQLEKHLQRTGD